MVRIRKPRLALTSSGKPELHESSNGGQHPHADSQSNPSFQDLRSSLLSPASITTQDHLLLAAGSATHRLPQKQLPAKAVSVNRKPYIVLSSGVESWDDGMGLMMKKGVGNPRAQSVMDVEHHEVKHMDGDDNVKSRDMKLKGCKELSLPGTGGEGGKLDQTCKKARPDIACKGSARLEEEINVHIDPAMIVAADYSRKVRPLQLILSSDYSPTAPKLPLPMCPTSSGSTMPPPPLLLRKFDRASPYMLTKTPPISSPDAGPLIKQMNIADVNSRNEIIRQEVASSSQNNSDRYLEGNRADFKSCGLLKKSNYGPVSSWQGHRRPRSFVQGGRGSMAVPDLNAVIKIENLQQRKKPKQPKRKSIDILVSPSSVSLQLAPTTLAAGNGDMRQHDLPAASKNKAHTQKAKNESTSAAFLLPISSAQSLQPTPATTTQLDSMRCRRKDGRRWQCKEQVIKVGAPFCHYHTLKMREKHARSVIRKLSKQLQGDQVKMGLSYANLSNKKTNNRRVGRSPTSSAAEQDGYTGGCDVTGEEEEDNEDEDELQQKMHAKLGKHMHAQQMLLESLTLRRRWRKKCKPCIRRLHDIHDRARPAAMDGLDFLNPCVEDTSNLKDSPPVRSGSPLPECLLNTDPYEWRSDFS